MAGLKELKNRIDSVKSTQKITSAMKMVAASRLRRAQQAAEAARPFAERMERVIGGMVAGLGSTEGAPPLLAGTGKDDVHLLVAMTSDRGLCGGFNSSIVRSVRQQIEKLEADGKTVKVLSVGRKARDLLRRDHGDKIVETFEDIGRTVVTLEDAQRVTAKIVEMFNGGEFDVCTITYNQFVSAMTQIVTPQQVIPVSIETEDDNSEGADPNAVPAATEFEPDEAVILSELLPKNLEVQILHGMLESNASEHGARMSAMDNATRNAGEMIDDLSLLFNRTRQAKITSELIEIISGAEAV